MFLSRFWTLLLVIASTVCLAILFLARDLVNRERQESAAEIIFKEVDKLDVGFTLHARKRLDVLLSVSADADVVSLMGALAANQSKLDDVRPKLLNTLNKLNTQLGKYQAQMLLAVDQKGQVVVKAGAKGRENGFSLAGIPVVEAALRGYVRDDVIKLGPEVYLVAARPVIARGRYVGAVVHAMQINDVLATSFSKTSQVVFYVGSTMLAVGQLKDPDTPMASEAEIAGPLENLEQSALYQKKGRSAAQRISTPKGDYLAVYSKIRGEAALAGVGWGAVIPVQRQVDLVAIYEEAGSQDVAALPLWWLVGGAVLLLLLGWLWPYLEAERPLGKLYKAMVALETADVKDQLNVYKFRRNVRKIAKAFNKVTEFKLRELANGMREVGSSKSVDSILGGTESIRLSSASFKFGDNGDVPAPPGAFDAPPPDAKAKLPSGPVKPIAPGRPPTNPQRPLTPPAGEAMATVASEIDEDAYFRQVHKEFVALKRKLGEPVDQLSFERFEVTLKKNRDALKARFNCSSVKFNVYEKSGKASLKAVPVK